jgi:sodium/hydrogen exchanger 8
MEAVEGAGSAPGQGVRTVVPSADEVAHEFGALNTLLLVVVLGLCILSAYLIRKNKFYYLPESAAAILVGTVVGGMARLFYPSRDELDFLSFNSDIFYFMLLPPIIFEAGYTVEKQHFFRNLGTVVLFAVFGTLVSTFVVGYMTYSAAYWGLINVSSDNPLEPLLFGSLISAVDPVATLSIMGSADLNCDPLLYSLIFGESVLNDAVAIVLFRTFLHEYSTQQPFTASTLMSVLSSFTLITLGSIGAGVAIGLTCSFLFKHTHVRDFPKFEISLLFLFAYGSYAFAEAVELSGIMALFFNGLVLSHYNRYNMSSTSQTTTTVIFASFASMSEFLIFLYMGMGVFTGRFKSWDWTFVPLAISFCLVGRMFNIFPFSMLANLCRRHKISGGMQVVMWFAGLRGAIAFALSQSMPGESKDVYASTTLMIVCFTTLVCGGATEPLLERMNVKLLDGSRSPSHMDDGVYTAAYESEIFRRHGNGPVSGGADGQAHTSWGIPPHLLGEGGGGFSISAVWGKVSVANMFRPSDRLITWGNFLCFRCSWTRATCGPFLEGLVARDLTLLYRKWQACEAGEIDLPPGDKITRRQAQMSKAGSLDPFQMRRARL